ncbi:hypothetical protein BC831DRAFT_441595 [Entophlyctis helioformis]|nr:hypothetical protein BC831DRAFT_441595 [Entophlyctis helioformis]
MNPSPQQPQQPGSLPLARPGGAPVQAGGNMQQQPSQPGFGPASQPTLRPGAPLAQRPPLQQPLQQPIRPFQAAGAQGQMQQPAPGQPALGQPTLGQPALGQQQPVLQDQAGAGPAKTAARRTYPGMEQPQIQQQMPQPPVPLQPLQTQQFQQPSGFSPTNFASPTSLVPQFSPQQLQPTQQPPKPKPRSNPLASPGYAGMSMGMGMGMPMGMGMMVPPMPAPSPPAPALAPLPAYSAQNPNQLAGAFAGMSMAGMPATPITAVNIMQGPPQIDILSSPPAMPDLLSLSAAHTPTSNAHPSYKRSTLNAIPQTPALLNKSRIPFGLVITPYRQLLSNDEPVPVINAPQVVRCRRCRTYINPWITFVDQGARWKCNLCFLTNEVPAFFDWDADNRTRVDRLQRPELTHGVVEFVAPPQEYMVRPPQPVVILFVIDVTYGAVQSGMVAVAARAILDSLDSIPNSDNRTKLGFITVDSAIHFYNLGASLSDPQMMVVADLDETFIPIPYDLLVSLTESRSVIERFLERLPQMFQNTQQTMLALGKALKAAQKIIGPIGGKIAILQHTLPNLEEGTLKMREDPKALGTAKEAALLQPAIPFYKAFAVDCSPMQVSMDVFAFNGQYADIATLSGCAKFTGGSVHYYPGFTASRTEDAIKFANELGHLLSRPLGLEAVMRMRATKGIKMTAFHGNFFLRSTDLLSLPNVNPDNSYAIELALVDTLTTNIACFQTSLLHTSSNGERRIRVITLALPVTSSLSEIYSAADQIAIMALLDKKAVDRSLTSKIDDAREAVLYKLSEMIAVYKSALATGGSSAPVVLPENLKLLPVLVLGLIKNLAYRSSTTIPSDLRSYMLALHYVLSPELTMVNLYPRFWNIDMLLVDERIGLPGNDGQIVFPPLLNLSSEKLDRQGIYLLDNGLELFVWVGKTANPDLCNVLLGKPSPDAILTGKTTLPVIDHPLNSRFRNLVDKVREQRRLMGTIYPHVYLVREDGDPSLRMWFLSHLIEDRFEQLNSYPQFLSVLKDSVAKISV